MKQPKKLTREQKIKLSKKGYSADAYMLLKEDADTFTAICKYPDDHGVQNTVTINK